MEPAAPGSAKRRITAFTVIYVLAHVVAIVVVPLVFPVRQWLADFVSWMGGLGGWGPVVMAAIFVPATLLLLPPGLLAIAAGYIFGLPIGFGIAMAGKTLGGVAAFEVARTFARDWVKRRIRGHRKLEAVDRAVAGHAFKVVALSRLSPVVPFGVINYTFGASKIRFGRYLAGTFVGGIPLTLIDVWIGSAAHSLADLISGHAHHGAKIAAFAVGIAASIAVIWIVHRAAKRALASADALPAPA